MTPRKTDPRPSRSPTVHDARVRPLNDRPARAGKFVLYWMQQSQRAAFNHALEHAVERANALGLPLRVGFGLMDDYPDANLRAYRFMLEGLAETAQALEARGIPLVLRKGSPPEVALTLAHGAAELICDRGYLRHQKQWRRQVADQAECPVVQVEADAVVPVAVASPKAEWAARTIRPRIQARLEEFLAPLAETPLAHRGGAAESRGLDLHDVEQVVAGLKLDRSVPPVGHLFRGGTREARRRLHAFVKGPLGRYLGNRPQPAAATVSHLGMYLHFGQISPVEIARAARQVVPHGSAELTSFLDELIVRRELAINFCEHTAHYDGWRAIPAWAQATLAAHARDDRPHVYTRGQLERAATHDPYFNAAMRELRFTGYMHNQMRMYWGKKILEWTKDPERAHATVLALNNRYFLDGRDCNSYANVAWIFGLHDRPWPERKIFGTVRSMMASGLERKGDMPAYVAAVDRRVDEAEKAGVRFLDDDA